MWLLYSGKYKIARGDAYALRPVPSFLPLSIWMLLSSDSQASQQGSVDLDESVHKAQTVMTDVASPVVQTVIRGPLRASLFSLPVELVYVVFALITLRDVSSLTRSSKYLYQLLTPQLYRTVYFSRWYPLSNRLVQLVLQMVQRTELLTYIRHFDMPVLHCGFSVFDQLRLRDVIPLMHSLRTLVLPEMDVLAYELQRDTRLGFLPATLEQLAFTRSCAVPLTWLGDAVLLRDRPKSAADQEGDDRAEQLSRTYDTWFAECYDMHSLLCRHELMSSLLASTNVIRVAFSCCDSRPGGPLHLKHLLLHGISFQRLEISYKAYMLLTCSAMGLKFNHLHTLVVKRILRGNRPAGDVYNETKQLIQPGVAAQFPALKIIRMSLQTHRYPNLLSAFPWVDLLWAALPSLELISIESFALDWYLEWHRSGQTMQLTLGPDIERHMERQEASERPWYGKPQSMWFEQHLVEPWRW